MRKGLLLLVTMMVLALAIVQPASAHVLKTDGAMGAVLHIQPDDNPTAGVVTTYELAFDDTAGAFDLHDCACTVTIQQNGQTIDQSPLVISGALSSVDTYTFKQADVYTVLVSGKPKNNASFQPFMLAYLVRVQSNNQLNAQPFPLALGVGFALMIVLLLLVAAKADGTMEQRDRKN